MEVHQVTEMACIDLSAAFDTVDHVILLDVLRVKRGITDWTSLPDIYVPGISWSMLENRIRLGYLFPQGRCAGPSLYSVYASTVSVRVPRNLEIHGYADDHQ